MLPRTHGSALFTRGQTQALSIVTIGSGQDQQKIDGLGLENFKRFMHQYNFPPYSVGEARPLRSPGRREIGHGALAERAVHNVMPDGRGVPVRRPHRHRDPLEQRLDVDGVGVRLVPGAHGRRRAR